MVGVRCCSSRVCRCGRRGVAGGGSGRLGGAHCVLGHQFLADFADFELQGVLSREGFLVDVLELGRRLCWKEGNGAKFNNFSLGDKNYIFLVKKFNLISNDPNYLENCLRLRTVKVSI